MPCALSHRAFNRTAVGQFICGQPDYHARMGNRTLSLLRALLSKKSGRTVRQHQQHRMKRLAEYAIRLIINYISRTDSCLKLKSHCHRLSVYSRLIAHKVDRGQWLSPFPLAHNNPDPSVKLNIAGALSHRGLWLGRPVFAHIPCTSFTPPACRCAKIPDVKLVVCDSTLIGL